MNISFKSPRHFSHMRSLTLDMILSVTNCICYICDCEIKDEKPTKDHVFPKSEGYKLSYNMMPAHHDCNVLKAHRWPTYDEVEKAHFAYQGIGCIFNPSHITDKSVISSPFISLVFEMRKN